VKPAEAARVYRETSEQLAAVAEVAKLNAEAAKVLKEHAKANPDLTHYRKLAFTRGSQRRFNQAKAKELLGDKKVAECMTTVETVGITLL